MRRNHLGYRVGESHHRAKLPDSTVKEMRSMREQGKSYREIGELIGCSLWTVRDIVTYATRYA